jgi:hypothetical protein
MFLVVINKEKTQQTQKTAVGKRGERQYYWNDCSSWRHVTVTEIARKQQAR